MEAERFVRCALKIGQDAILIDENYGHGMHPLRAARPPASVARTFCRRRLKSVH